MAKLNIKSALQTREERIDSNLDFLKERKLSKIEVKNIEKYGNLVHLTEDIINLIDFNDKRFINRIYDDTEELKNEDLDNLKESIKEIGLMNIVYIQEKNSDLGKKFFIISGLRRLLSIRELLEAGEKIKELDRLIIFSKETPLNFLEKLSIDENTKRVNLSLLEEAYKIDKYAKAHKKTMEETAEFFKISRKHATRLRTAINYPKVLKENLNSFGIRKADIMNKIIKTSSEIKNTNEVFEEIKNKTLEELEGYLRNLRKKDKEVFQWKTNKRNTQVIINIKSSLNSESEKLILEFKEKFENLLK